MKHFALYELVDRVTYTKWGELAFGLFAPDLLIALDGVRDFFNVPITVNNWYGGGPFQYRGYRGPDCPVGAENSYHKKGMAADFDVQGLDADVVRGMIMEHQNDPLLEKIQRLEADVNWVHMDVGKVPEGKQRIYVFKA
jgi:hypothetical protein